jgi:hypothetical protein
MALKVEGVVDGGVHAQKPLDLTAGHDMPPVRRLTAILAADVAGY